MSPRPQATRALLPSLCAALLLGACSEQPPMVAPPRPADGLDRPLAGRDSAPAAPAPAQALAQAPAPAAAPAPAPAPPASAKPQVAAAADGISTAAADVTKGEQVFAAKGCVSCHKVGGGKLVGPDLKGVLARRSPEWVKKMILQPEVMLKEDEVARKLLAEHMVPMPNQGVDPQAELPLILAYLKKSSE